VNRRQLLSCATFGFVVVSDDHPSANVRVEISAGNAAATLTEFIRQTKLQVLFEADAIRGHKTRAVSGRLEAREALRAMLEGSGLIFEIINERTYAVRPAPFAPTRL
jgi:hypothetical protein